MVIRAGKWVGLWTDDRALGTRFILNRQPGKALPYYLKLRRPGVFNLIREHNLFPDIQDQALLLIEFDQDMQLRRKRSSRDGTDASWVDVPDISTEEGASRHGTAITLLIDHTHSIPVSLLDVVALIYSRLTFSLARSLA